MGITILGTAAAEALPAPFCECPTWVDARATGGRNRSKGTATLINRDLLVDCGPDLIAATQQYRISLSSVETLLITHAHGDHWHPSNVFTRLPGFCPTTSAPLNIYAPGSVTGPLRRPAPVVGRVTHAREERKNSHSRQRRCADRALLEPGRSNFEHMETYTRGRSRIV